jgi:DNA-binding transcriptional MocR family regulator
LFKIVAVPLNAFRSLSNPQDRWLLTCFSAYVDKAGRAFCSLRQLVRDARMSLPTVSRRMAAMAAQGVFHRERKPGGRYHYVLAEAYRPRWPGKGIRGVSAPREGVPPTVWGVSQRETQQAKPTKQDHKADAPSRSAPGRVSPEPASTGFGVDQAFRWRAYVRQYREAGRWREAYGPKPGEAGCRAPAETLVAFGYAASALLAAGT